MATYKFKALQPHYKAGDPDVLINREECNALPGCSHCILCTFLEEGLCEVCNQRFY